MPHPQTAAPAQAAKVRRLKVYDKIFTRCERQFFGSYTVLLPEIRLIGKWLADCGSAPGQHIEVTTERGKLTIVPSGQADPTSSS